MRPAPRAGFKRPPPLAETVRLLRLHVVRHGETEANATGVIQGDFVDGPLNALGMRQAASLGGHFRKHPPRLILTSPLLRARQTAQAIADATDAPLVVLRGLREISWGDYNGRPNVGQTKEAMEAILRAWDQGDLTKRAPAGETPHDAWARAKADLAPHLDGAEGDVALVGHGRINKILLSGLVHGTPARMEDFPQSNAAITILQRESDAWRTLARNLKDHLGDVPSQEERQS